MMAYDPTKSVDLSDIYSRLSKLESQLTAMQHRAEAYDREHAIKSAGEFKALLLESTNMFVHPHIEGVFAVLEERLRAANKKENE